MGVPITFLDKYNPEQFEIIGLTDDEAYLSHLWKDGHSKYDRCYLNGKRKYPRLIIRNLHPRT